MFDVSFRCPKTGVEVYTSIALNEFSSEPQTFTVVCVQCGDEHRLRSVKTLHKICEAEVIVANSDE
jgi:hypothetical protein